MNLEKLIAKKVAHKYENGEVLFNVESLHEHYEGINYHLTDILEGGFIRVNDILDGDVREVEVKTEEIPVDELPAPAIEDFPVWVNPPIEEIEVVADVVAPAIT